MGPESPPGKGGNHPEASIGESSEMAASSVCSEHKSRVIEPRNIERLLELSPLCQREQHQSVKSLTRWSGRGLRAGQMCERVPWKLERTSCLLFGSGQSKGRHWQEQQPGTPEGDLAAGVSERAKHEEVSMAERNEAVETDKGSRSVFIVAPESRETDPREPVSSQGGRRVTELPLGNTR